MVNAQTQDRLRQRYNPDNSQLRALQIRMLEILICIDQICQEHDIPYWLGSGTLLGAVRHGGFIPWDDDIDIELLRADYLKLIKILSKELPKKYALQTQKSDSGYVYLYAKVRDTQSLVKEKCVFNKQFEYNGAFIDIFPLEHTHKHLARIASVCYNRLCLGTASRNSTRKLFKFNYKLLTKIIFPFFRIFSLACDKGILHHTYGVGFLNNERNIKDIFPLTKIEFEGYLFNAPYNRESYLKKLYGQNYMNIPQNIETHFEENDISIW